MKRIGITRDLNVLITSVAYLCELIDNAPWAERERLVM